MNIYPAIKLHMGHPEEGWDYYVISMKMKDLGKEIGFASEFSQSRTLTEVLQRQLNEAKATKEMGSFLANRDDRFYSSIVVAALEGEPTWRPLTISESDDLGILEEASKQFGLLRFNGGQKYYALDGQHRLKSIMNVLDPTTEPAAPEGFENEELSVIIMLVREGAQEAWVTKYRRLFSTLNRHAKPVDKDTIIIMEEDDAFAMSTRRMLEEYPFFQWNSDADSNPVVKTKGNNLKEGNPEVTTLQSLYKFNMTVLNNIHNREIIGNNPNDFIKIRPSDEVLDLFYDQIKDIWDCLLEAIPDFRKDPRFMRTSKLDPEIPDLENNIVFRPVILTDVLAKCCLFMIDRCDELSTAELSQKFQKFSKVPLSITAEPWAHLLGIYDPVNDSWKMVSESRAACCKVALKIVLWMTGIADFEEEDIKEIEAEWGQYTLTLPQSEKIEIWKRLRENYS